MVGVPQAIRVLYASGRRLCRAISSCRCTARLAVVWEWFRSTPELFVGVVSPCSYLYRRRRLSADSKARAVML